MINYAVFGKSMENIRKNKDTKFVTNDSRMNYLVSERNYHTKNVFLKFY